MNKTLRTLLAALACGLVAPALADPLPIRAFFEPAAFSNLRLSPDGTSLAMLAHLEYREEIYLLDLRTMKAAQIGLVDLNDHVGDYWWKGNETLLLQVERGSSTAFRTLNVLTKKINPLYTANDRNVVLVHSLPTDPDNVMVSAFNATGYGADLRRLNVQTGKLTTIERGKFDVSRWIANENGEPVAAFGRASDDKWFMLVRHSPNVDWTRQPLGSDYRPDFLPVTVHLDQHRLVGWDFTAGETARGIILDPATGAKESLFQSSEVEPDSFQFWSDDATHPMAINYETDRPQRHYLDDTAAATMTKIDSALPGRINTVIGESKNGSLLVVWSTSDRHPGEYYLLNATTGRLSALGANNAGLPETAMSPSRFFRFAARDGLPLSGRITLPLAGTNKPPLLLLVGPYVDGPRARYGFDRVDQLLASRGYAVARINWRGMTGFGRSFIKAGDKQVTTGMPNDLEDGVRWLQAQGWVDGRAGIFGYNAGELLALQLAGRSSLFSIWINFNGWTSFRSFNYEDVILSEHKAEDVLTQLGGRSAAWDYVKSLDKVGLPAEVKIPAFHFYSDVGGDQKRALAYSKRAGQPYVTLIGHDYYYNKAHYQDNWELAGVEQKVEIYTQLLDFLQKYLPAGGVATPPRG